MAARIPRGLLDRDTAHRETFLLLHPTSDHAQLHRSEADNIPKKIDPAGLESPNGPSSSYPESGVTRDCSRWCSIGNIARRAGYLKKDASRCVDTHESFWAFDCGIAEKSESCLKSRVFEQLSQQGDLS